MTTDNDIFAGDAPHEILARWMSEAEGTEPGEPNAMALATVDATGLPDVRIVLMKACSAEGLEFYTNYESRKGAQLVASGKAAANFHWKGLKRQVRVRGTVTKVSPEVSDAYFASRPLGSRIGTWASRQSQPLPDRETLLDQVARAEKEHGTSPQRPPHWGGFLLTPSEFEFWADGEYRLHNRFRWAYDFGSRQWAITRLNP